MGATIQHRRDTAEGWSTANPVLAAGELGVELPGGLLKVGDGATAWDNLDYISGGTSASGGSPIMYQDAPGAVYQESPGQIYIGDDYPINMPEYSLLFRRV